MERGGEAGPFEETFLKRIGVGSADVLLAGVLLVSGVVFVLIQAPLYRRGGFDGKFWQLPLEGQLTRIAEKDREWRWIAAWSMAGISTVTGGIVVLSALIGESADTALGSAGLGIYLIAAAAWVFGLMVSYASMSRAARVKADTGNTPSWVAPLGDAAYMAEATWVIGSNIAYALLGTAVLSTGILPLWAGWSAVGIGIGIVAIVLITRTGFPQMGDLAPFVLGVAAILEGL